jgi:hypothetical protein
MLSTRCKICQGSGTVMGGGMIYHDCLECKGSGKIQKPENEISYLQIKQSETFQNAIKEIKSIDPKLSNDDAEKLMEKQFYKQRGKTRKSEN